MEAIIAKAMRKEIGSAKIADETLLKAAAIFIKAHEQVRGR